MATRCSNSRASARLSRRQGQGHLTPPTPLVRGLAARRAPRRARSEGLAGEPGRPTPLAPRPRPRRVSPRLREAICTASARRGHLQKSLPDWLPPASMAGVGSPIENPSAGAWLSITHPAVLLLQASEDSCLLRLGLETSPLSTGWPSSLTAPGAGCGVGLLASRVPTPI